MLFKPKRLPLPQTQSDMDQLAVDFLQDNGFEVTPDMLAMFGSFISHSDQMEDTYNPILLRKMIRKQIANGLAFYLVKPERRPEAKKVEEAAAPVTTSELADETEE
jgi:hypothetical protein